MAEYREARQFVTTHGALLHPIKNAPERTRRQCGVWLVGRIPNSAGGGNGFGRSLLFNLGCDWIYYLHGAPRHAMGAGWQLVIRLPRSQVVCTSLVNVRCAPSLMGSAEPSSERCCSFPMVHSYEQ